VLRQREGTPELRALAATRISDANGVVAYRGRLTAILTRRILFEAVEGSLQPEERVEPAFECDPTV